MTFLDLTIKFRLGAFRQQAILGLTVGRPFRLTAMPGRAYFIVKITRCSIKSDKTGEFVVDAIRCIVWCFLNTHRMTNTEQFVPGCQTKVNVRLIRVRVRFKG